ncbi:hypothetical protein [Actibacterium sp. D379-3]
MTRAVLFLLCSGLLGGCATFPEVDAAMLARGKDIEFPVLVPLESLLDGGAAPRLDAASGPQLAARAAALQARAARLRRDPVLTGAERDRLQQAVVRHNG